MKKRKFFQNCFTLKRKIYILKGFKILWLGFEQTPRHVKTFESDLGGLSGEF